MRKLNSIPGRRLYRGSRVTCPRLTMNQVYVIVDIYEESPGVISCDLRLPDAKGKVASVSAHDVFPLVNEGTRPRRGNSLNG